MELNSTQILDIAAAAANKAYAMAQSNMELLVRDQLPALVKPLVEEVHVRRHAVYTQPPQEKVSNYGNVIISASKWAADKGPALASIILIKSDNPKQTLFIEQFGQECLLKLKDMGQKSATLDARNQTVIPGLSIWTKWHVIQGLLEEIVAKQKAKGWEVFQAAPMHQLGFVDAV